MKRAVALTSIATRIAPTTKSKDPISNALPNSSPPGWSVPRRHSWFTTPTSEKKNFGAAMTRRLGTLGVRRKPASEQGVPEDIEVGRNRVTRHTAVSRDVREVDQIGVRQRGHLGNRENAGKVRTSPSAAISSLR